MKSEIVAPNGKVTTVLTDDGTEPLEAPNYVALDRDGRVYLSDPCAAKLIRFDPSSGLVDAILAAGSKAPAGEVFQIASGREHTVLEMASLLREILERHDVAMELVHGPQRRGDAPRNYSDTSKAARLLDWRSQVSLAEGLVRTVESFLDG